MDWKVADAKNRFSELMTKALEDGPQRITRRDGTVVMISEKELERIEGKKPDFIDFLMSGPGFEGVDLERDKQPLRDIEW
jgi:prevent-host-death family protein